jgi:hypothetical protein
MQYVNSLVLSASVVLVFCIALDKVSLSEQDRESPFLLGLTHVVCVCAL